MPRFQRYKPQSKWIPFITTYGPPIKAMHYLCSQNTSIGMQNAIVAYNFAGDERSFSIGMSSNRQDWKISVTNNFEQLFIHFVVVKGICDLGRQRISCFNDPI